MLLDAVLDTAVALLSASNLSMFTYCTFALSIVGIRGLSQTKDCLYQSCSISIVQ